MSQPLRLFKGHGLGNDYLVLEEGGPLDPDLCARICHRHTGFGADGLLEPAPAGPCDYGVTIWNPDGSIAEKSGNGLRIYARWLREHRGAPSCFSMWTGSCAVPAVVRGAEVELGMGEAVVRPRTVELEGEERSVVAVDLGNPHCVWFVPPEVDLDELPWRRWGAALERHPAFPGRTNVQFVRLDGDTPIIRIWERGAGETAASGSSSCAVVAAAVATGRLAPGRYEVHMPGGTLQVRVDEELAVTLTGPVAFVGRLVAVESWLGR